MVVLLNLFVSRCGVRILKWGVGVMSISRIR